VLVFLLLLHEQQHPAVGNEELDEFSSFIVDFGLFSALLEEFGKERLFVTSSSTSPIFVVGGPKLNYMCSSSRPMTRLTASSDHSVSIQK
jgi:hypothetical protein